MFIRHSLKNILRAWPKSALFFLLLAVLGAMLCVGVSLTAAILSFLKECDENYTTIAVFEYIGESYPDEERYDPDIARCMEAFDFSSIADNPAVLNWDENAVALGSIWGKTTDSAEPPYKKMLVAVIYILSYNERIGAYQYSVVEDLLNPDAPTGGGYLDTNVIDLEIGGMYLIHGSRGSQYTGMGSTSYLIVSPFHIASAVIAGVDASAENMILDVGTGRGNYEVPPGSDVYLIAETYAAVNTGVTVHATNDLDAYLPFHQAKLSVVSGRSFTPEEYSDGAKVCILPERMAGLLEVGPGDRITLSLAVQAGASQHESYWAGAGFAYENDYEIVGIFSPNDDFRETIYIPKSGETDLSENSYSFTLGQARLRNDRAGQFYLDMVGQLPPRVRMTVYDQGYSAAAAPVRDVLRIAVIITVVCALATLVMLALFGFLFVYRQRGLAKTMRRVGAPAGGIYLYFTFGSGCLALLGAAAGAFISQRLSGRFMDIVRQSIANYSTDNLRYSNTNLTITKTLEFAPDVALSVFILTALALFFFAVLSCFVFATSNVSSTMVGGRRGRRGRKQVGKGAGKKARGPADTTTARSPLAREKARSLRGGSLKYSWLSVRRGASRSALPFVLCAVAAALLLQLTGATVAYENSYRKLVEDADVSGYITDSRGAWRYGILLDGEVISDLYNSGILSGISVTKSGWHHNYGLEPPEAWNVYTTETFINYLASGPGFIWTNDLASTQEFLDCADLPVTFMSGYDISMFSYIPPDDELFYSTGTFTDWDFDGWIWPEEKWRQSPGIVSTAFLEEHGLAFGDIVELTISEGSYYDYRNVEIVGSYVRQGSADNIYVPLSSYHNIEIAVRTTGVNRRNLTYNYMYEDVPSAYIFSEDPDPDLLRKLSFSSVGFTMRGASGLEAFKDFLYSRGYSEVTKTRTIRSYITIEDKTFIASERAMAQRLWYMQKIFPALFILIELLAALIPFILIQLRKRESALMRAQGAAKHTAFFSIFWEQAILCLPGVIAGGGVWLAAAGAPARLGMALAAAFALLWLIGAGISAFALNRGSVRTILKAEE